MNTGQMMLTLGALMLISVTILNFNRHVMDIQESLDHDRFRLEALSILTSHIEEISQYFFDEVSTDTTQAKELTTFTMPANLGMDGDDAGIPDDIDDLHGLTIADTGRSGAVYEVTYNVEYVQLSSGVLQAVNSRQWHKRIQVFIADTYDPPLITRQLNGNTVKDTLRMETVISYWFYN